MSNSILISTKEKLGLAADYTAFDTQIIDYINGVFSTLHDLGVGPAGGFAITDDESTWSDFTLDDPRLQDVPTYLYLRVRMMFDPPNTSFTQASMQKQIDAHEYRLMVRMEGEYLPPGSEEVILEGGAP